MHFIRKNSQAPFRFADKRDVKAIGAAIFAAVVMSVTALASESYVVVRLNDPQSRDVVARSGAIEVTNPDLRPDEVLVLATAKQLEALGNEPAIAFYYPASQDLIAGVPANACYRQELAQIGEYVMAPGAGWTAGLRRAGAAYLFARIGFPEARQGTDVGKYPARVEGVVHVCPGGLHVYPTSRTARET